MKIYALLSTAYSSGFHSISFTLCWIIVQESGEIAQRTVKEPFAPASKFSIDRFFLSGVNLDFVLSKQVRSYMIYVDHLCINPISYGGGGPQRPPLAELAIAPKRIYIY